MQQANTALQTRDEILAAEVAGIKKTIGAPSSNVINTKGKMFTFPDGTSHPGPLSVVILDYVSHNSYFSGVYDAKKVVPPACFSSNKNIDELKPSANAPEPQHTDCPSCPRNQFGSAATGRGKACKNTRRLAVTTPGATKDGQIMTLSVSPTAIKAFDAFVAKVARDYATPPVGVVALITFNPDEAYPTLQFAVSQVKDAAGNELPVKPGDMDAMMYMRPIAQEMLLREPELRK